jgi:hypothetical protein
MAEGSYFMFSSAQLKINNSSDRHLRSNHPGKKPMVFMTFPLLIASEIAYTHGNKELALGFAAGGLVTSSVGLAWYIRDKKKK